MLTLYDQRRTGESGGGGGSEVVENDDVRNNIQQDDGEPFVRDIHALTSPENRSHALPPPPPYFRRYFNSPARSTGTASLSDDAASSAGAENFTTISREFNALVLAGYSMDHQNNNNNNNNTGYNSMNNNNNNSEENNNNYQVGPLRPSSNHDRELTRIGEGEEGPGEVPQEEEMNPLAIVPDGIGPSGRGPGQGPGTGSGSVQRVRREEVEAKIMAWQNAKLAKINNRFKREDAIISGWENEQVNKASSWMKKVERRLEEKRARATEKMQNEVARARRKAEERRATAEGKRGAEVAKVLELSNLMRAVGRPPSKRSFFSFH